MEPLNTVVVRAKAGDLEAFARIVAATQTMAFAVASSVLRDPGLAQDAWDVTVEDHGRWSEVVACGIFTDRVVAHLGADPAIHTAVGIGY